MSDVIPPIRTTLTPAAKAKHLVHEGAELARKELLDTTLKASTSATFGLMSTEPDPLAIARDSAVILGTTALAGAVGRLEHRLGEKLSRLADQGQNPQHIDSSAVKAGLDKSADYANPIFGFSGCVDIGKTMQKSGVTGTVCAGIGFGGDITPNLGKRKIGVIANISF
jgi:hypothetical protein